MAISPFSQPLQTPVVPIPFEALQQAGAMKQARYDAADAAVNQFSQSLYDRPRAIADRQEYDRVLGDIESQISGLIESEPDLGSAEFHKGINDIIRNTSKNQFLRDTQENAVREQELMNIANSNLPAPLRFRAQKELSKFQELGTTGYGLLDQPITPQEVDYYDVMNKRSDKAVREGVTNKMVQYDEKSGQIISVDTGYAGILASEVGDVYGYSVTTNGEGKITSMSYKGIPQSFKNSGAYENMVRQAEFNTGTLMSEDPGLVQAEAERIYKETAEDLIPLKSGLTVASSDESRPISVGRGGKNEGGEDYNPYGIKGDVTQLPGRPSSERRSLRYISDQLSKAEEYSKLSKSAETQYDKRYYMQMEDAARFEAEVEQKRLDRFKKETGDKLGIDYEKETKELSINRLIIAKEYLPDDELEALTAEGRISSNVSEEIKPVYTILNSGFWDENDPISNDLDGDGMVTMEDVTLANEALDKYSEYLVARGHAGFVGKKSYEEILEEIKAPHAELVAIGKVLSDKIDSYGDSKVEKGAKNDLRKYKKTLNKTLIENATEGYTHESIPIPGDSEFSKRVTGVVNQNISLFEVINETKGDDRGPLEDFHTYTYEIGSMNRQWIPGLGIVLKGKATRKTESGDDKKIVTLHSDAIEGLNTDLARYILQSSNGDTDKIQDALNLANPKYLDMITRMEVGNSYAIYDYSKGARRPLMEIRKDGQAADGSDMYSLYLLDDAGNIKDSAEGIIGENNLNTFIIKLQADMLNNN